MILIFRIFVFAKSIIASLKIFSLINFFSFNNSIRDDSQGCTIFKRK